MGAVILSSAYSVDRGLLIPECVLDPYKEMKIGNFDLILDSFGLYGTVTTFREGRDYRLRPTVSQILDSYERGELHTLLCGAFPTAKTSQTVSQNITIQLA